MKTLIFFGLLAFSYAARLNVEDFELSVEGEPAFTSNPKRSLLQRKLSMEDLPETLDLDFTVEGTRYKTKLFRQLSKVFPETATVHIGGESGVRTFKPHKIYSYRSEDNSWYLGFYHGESFEGVYNGRRFLSFKLKDGKLTVENSLNDYYKGGILHDYTDMGQRSRSLRDKFTTNCYPGENVKRTFKIGVTVGNELFKLFSGESNPESRVVEFINVITEVSNILYVEQLNLEVVIDSTVIAEDSSGFYPWNNPGCNNDITSQLYQLQGWSSRPKRLGLWHLLDRCFGFSGSTLGIAKLGVLCANRVNVGVSYVTGNDEDRGTRLDLDLQNDFQAQRDMEGYPTWATYAHELGHNFGASHSFELGQGRTGGIMDYGTIVARLIDNEIQFNILYRKRDICGEIASVIQRCGFAFDIATVSASPTPSPVTTGCTLFDQKVYRGIADVLPGEFSDFTVASCLDECNQRPACKSFVVSEARGYCELWSKVTTSDLDDTTPQESSFDTYICDTPDTSDPESPTRKPTPSPVQPPRVCIRHRNRVIFGTADIYSGGYDGWTEEACLNACEQLGCKAFIHSSRYGYCELWSQGDESDLNYYFGYNTILCQVGNDVPRLSESLEDNIDEIEEEQVAAIAEKCCTTEESKYNLAEGTFPPLEASSAADCTKRCVREDGCLSSSFSSDVLVEQTNCELFSIKNSTGTGSEFAEFSTSDCNRACISQEVFKDQFGTLTPAAIGFIAAAGVVLLVGAAAFVLFRGNEFNPKEFFQRNTYLNKAGNKNSVSHYLEPKTGNTPAVTQPYM